MTRSSLAPTAFAAALILTLLAAASCASTVTDTPTPLASHTTVLNTSTATDTPIPLTGKVTVLSTSAFMFSYTPDQAGSKARQEYDVVGFIRNDTNQPLKSIQLSITMTDASGSSLLKDAQGEVIPTAQFPPDMSHLLSGEESPFHYANAYLATAPASYEVTVTGLQATEFERAAVEFTNAEIVESPYWLYTYGNYLQLNGIVANRTSHWISVGSVSGVGSDSQGHLVTEGAGFDYAILLAPAGDTQGRDRTPCKISLRNPGGVTKWTAYVDAMPYDPTTTEPQLAVQVTNHFLDDVGDYHVVGWMANEGSAGVVFPSVVAGVYASDGTLLDDSMGGVGSSFYVQAGKRVPFDVHGFDLIIDRPQDAKRLDHCTVQFLLNQALQAQELLSKPEYVDLQSENDMIQTTHQAWIFFGDVTNTSDKDLERLDLIAVVYDSKGNLVATRYTSVSATGGVIAPGKTSKYQAVVFIDPKVDYREFTSEVIVRGYVKAPVSNPSSSPSGVESPE